MTELNAVRWIAFEGQACVAEGAPADVARAAKLASDREDTLPVVVFDADSSQVVEIDYRGSVDDVVRRVTATDPDAQATAPRPVGRPRLGVVAREVTLLPRHWEWLGTQPGGASVALRKLVESASREKAGADQKRQRQEAAYRFMTTMAGNLPGYEEALRALFRADGVALKKLTQKWPVDIRRHARKLAEGSH